MYSKLHFVYVLLFVGILELPTVVMKVEEEEIDSYEYHLRGSEVRCMIQPNSWGCFRNRTVLHRFYYDITMKSCKTYPYGGCDLNLNGFTSLDDCSSACHYDGEQVMLMSAEKMEKIPTGIVCSFQQDFGSCFKYYPMYYFDISSRTCKGFSYSGCGGNRNKFATAHECIDICGQALPPYKLVQRKKV